jgi:hypothetical protein
MIANDRLAMGNGRLLGRTFLVLLLACCVTDVACPQGEPAPSCDVRPRPLEQIPPGTAVGNHAPAGWTHLILKSRPRAAAGDVGLLTAEQASLASLLFTAIVADVQNETGNYCLARLAVGMGVRVGESDLIVTPASQGRLGAKLDFAGRIILARAQDKLAQLVTLARSPTFAIFDAPNLMLRGGRHRPVVLRYAVLVEPGTGRLDTLVWLLDRTEEGDLHGPIGAAQWLSGSRADDCVLHIDSREFTLGIPTEQAFALARLPAGQREAEIPDRLRGLASRQRLSAAAARDLENGLRSLLQDATGR